MGAAKLNSSLLESEILKVSGVLVAVAVGVPAMAPVDEFSDNPDGSAPFATDQV